MEFKQIKKYFAVFLFFLYVLVPENALCQDFRLHQSAGGAKVLYQNGDTMQFPWSGGMLNPQFSNIDINEDGRQDLFVFEPVGNKVSIFISITDGSFIYAPQYETFFPKLRSFALLADYNKDGKADIFTYSKRGAGFDIFKNISSQSIPAFVQVADRLEYEDVGFNLNLYVPSTDIPAIADIDNDGDLDILSYDVLQTYIQYYKNQSMEKYGVPDSLDFKIADRCWGKFAESFSANTVILGEDCGSVGKREKKHGGSTLAVFDYDGDGDKEMLLGDMGYNNLIFLDNGRINNGTPFTRSDSIISVNPVFPDAVNAMDITIFPAAFLVDINEDGKDDIIVTPQGLNESKTTRQVLSYINEGTKEKPDFKFLRDNFLQNLMIDGGLRSAPAFLDFNADGLQDLVISVKANTDIIYRWSKLQLYQNVGTSSKAVFKLVADDLANISQLNLAALTPAFKDLNSDGKPDLILGSENGEILFYYNQGLDVNNVPVFSSAQIQNIDVGEYSKPSAADLDRDGLTDLVIGAQSGNFYYFRNTGSANSPAFTLITDTFGNVVTNHFYYEYEYDNQGEIIDSTRVKEENGNSAPEIADVDNDGKWDMISGTIHGELIIYFNIENNLNGTFTPSTEHIFNPVLNQNIAKEFSFLSIPAAADLNGDNKPEIMIGNYLGGLYFLASQPVIIGIEKMRKKSSSMALKVFPNPAKETAYIVLPENASGKNFNLKIVNSIGKLAYRQTVKNALGGTLPINIKSFAAGLYFIILEDAAGNFYSAKLYLNQ